jgi:hypothetical protein
MLLKPGTTCDQAIKVLEELREVWCSGRFPTIGTERLVPTRGYEYQPSGASSSVS